jgi:two-component system NtrC family sensor kinase
MDYRQILYSIPPLLTLLCYVALGLLVLHRGLKALVNKLLFLICFAGTLLYLDILIIFNIGSSTVALFSSRLDHCCVVFTIPLFMHFFRAYLNISGHTWALWFAYGYSMALMPFALTPLLIEDMQRHAFGFFGRGGPLYSLIGAGAAMALLYCLFWLGWAIRREESSIQKNKLKYLCAGFASMGVLNGLNVLPILGYPVYPLGTFSFVPLVVFAVGLFRYDLLDMGVLLRKSLLYSLLTALLICLYSLVVSLANAALTRYGFGNFISYNILFFLLVAAIFGPVKTTIQRYLDRMFYRRRYDYRKTIRKLGQTIISTLNESMIAQRLSDTVVDQIMLTDCRLFLKTTSDLCFRVAAKGGSKGRSPAEPTLSLKSPLVQFMKKGSGAVIKTKLLELPNDPVAEEALKDMEALSAEVVLPLVFNSKLNGFIGFGQKKSGELFSSEDIDLLTALALQTSVAIENAKSYHRLDDLNKTLEIRVEQRTEALKKVLSEKEKTQEQLVRSESLASIGLLVAGTAHELNNPLTSAISLIQSTVEDLARPGSTAIDEHQIVPDLLLAGRELTRAKAIIASLLGLSRQTRTYSEKVDLDAVIKDAVRVLKNQFKPTCPPIITKLNGSLPRITGNYAGLGQVTVNLVKNALQAAAQVDGKVRLSTYYEPQGHHVVFSCRDTGPGITRAVRQDMFKPFFTTKDVGEGTGLGLYICHEIIEKHNGCIGIKSQPGKGAHFKVKLPVKPRKFSSPHGHPCLTILPL